MKKISFPNLTKIAAVAMLGLFTIIPAASYGEKDKELFSEHDAKELRYSDKEFEKETAPGEQKSDDKAPSIIIEEPAVIEMKKGPMIESVSPINVYVTFKQNASELNLGSLEVWGEKFFFKKDLTNRVLPYLKVDREGAYIDMKSIHVPKGNYKVGFKISDVDGRETKAKYKLKVE